MSSCPAVWSTFTGGECIGAPVVRADVLPETFTHPRARRWGRGLRTSGIRSRGRSATIAGMSAPDTTTEASADTRPGADALPDYAPVPRSALGPALNEQGYYVGRVERNLYWVTDGTYQ